MRLLYLALLWTLVAVAPLATAQTILSTAPGANLRYEFHGIPGVSLDLSGIAPAYDLFAVGGEGSSALDPLGVQILRPHNVFFNPRPATKLNTLARRGARGSIELLLTPQRSDRRARGTLLYLGTRTGKANLALLQVGSSLEIQIRTGSRNLKKWTVRNVFAAGRLTQLVLTSTGQTLTLYRNGTRLARQSARFAGWSNQAYLSVANTTSFRNPLVGTIYLLAAYSRALSRDEVMSSRVIAIPARAPSSTASSSMIVSSESSSSSSTVATSSSPGSISSSSSNGGASEPCHGHQFLWQVYGAAAQSVNLTPFPNISLNSRTFPASWWGLAPYLKRINVSSNIYQPINGGVPQRANLTAHLELARQQLIDYVPNPNYDGILVIDYEMIRPVWELIDEEYREYSRQLVLEQYPSMTAIQVEAIARQQYESAAMELMLATIRMGKATRPRAKWGFYGLYPAIFWVHYFDHPEYRARNDGLGPLIQESDVMTASIYQFYDSAIPENAVLNRLYIEDMVGEARRLATQSGNPPVFTYVWYRYQSETGGNGMGYVSTATLRQAFFYPFSLGVSGALIFGWESWAPSAPEFNHYVQEHLGPEIENFCENPLR